MSNPINDFDTGLRFAIFGRGGEVSFQRADVVRTDIDLAGQFGLFETGRLPPSLQLRAKRFLIHQMSRPAARIRRYNLLV